MTDKSNEKIKTVIKPDKELVEKTKAAMYENERPLKKSRLVVLRRCAIAAAVYAVACFAAFGAVKNRPFTDRPQASQTQGTSLTAEGTTGSAVNAADEITKAVSAKQSGTVKCNTNMLDIMKPIRTDEEKFNRPDVSVIHGIVTKSHYVLEQEDSVTVVTKSEVKVLKCYKGSIKEGTTVTVREMGGFIPSDIYENAIHREKYGTDAAKAEEVTILDIRSLNYKVLEEGEDVILFLIPYNYERAEEFKGECYGMVGFWQGKLLFNEKAGAYIPFVPEDMLSDVDAKAYTLEEFEAFAAEQTKGQKQSAE